MLLSFLFPGPFSFPVLACPCAPVAQSRDIDAAMCILDVLVLETVNIGTSDTAVG